MLRVFRKICFVIVILFGINYNTSALEYNGRHGWPSIKAPKRLILCPTANTNSELMLLESLSGLAAQAVNEGRFDTMLWMDVGNYFGPSYENLKQSSIEALGITDIKQMTLDEIVILLKKKGVIKGYVRYTQDSPKANPYKTNPDTNYSSNVATIYASLLKGVLIDDELLDFAKKHKLKELKDARFESTEECFELNKDKLNNCSALSVPPSVHHMRDYAIAHKLMLYADQKEIIETVLEWVEPLSPILGWGCGDEYDFTSIIARWGHYNTASNYCWNLPFLSSVGKKATIHKAKELGPDQIDFSDDSSFHSFIMSDGDNIQWSMNNYGLADIYMGNPDIDKVGLSWSVCPINLSIVSPFTWNMMVDKQLPNFSFLEYGGGYQYPDIFASKRPNRLELVREFARRINYHLQELDIKIFGFICFNVASAEAQEAFQIYAEEMPGLTGMIAIQYFPYELEGEVYWKTNKQGIDIPVATTRYCLWNEVNPYRPRAGVPEYIASLINRDELVAQEKGLSTLSMTISHAWSDYSETSRITPSPAIGFNPVKVTQEMLLPNIKCVSVNELLWRIRMKYHPEQTKQIINSIKNE